MDEAQRQSIVDAVQVKHPGVKLYGLWSDAAGRFFVHRRALRGERHVYRQLRSDGKVLDAQDALMSAVLYPEPAEFKKVLEEEPFAVESLENAILAASGVYLDAQRKKYE